MLGPLSQADRTHLCQRADRLGDLFLDRLYAGDERRADRSKARHENTELALGRTNLDTLLNHLYLLKYPVAGHLAAEL